MPVKSLLRSKCVCKLWCATIENCRFVEEHMKRSKVVHVYSKDKINADGDGKEWKWWIVKDGLVVEKANSGNNYRIRNPATKHMLDLPDPYHKLRLAKIFYIPTIDKYKLVNVYSQKGTRDGGCQVLTVGTDLTWRTLDIPSFYNLYNSKRKELFSVATNDIFFVIRFSDVGIGASEIVCLEMENERSVHMKIPQGFFSCWKNVQPLAWENKLCMSNLVEHEIHFWILKDYKKQKWAENKMVISLSFLSKYPNITQKPIPHKVTNGCLWFYQHEEYQIDYYIKSGRVFINYPPPGEKYGSILSIPLCIHWDVRAKGKLKRQIS